MMDLKTFYHACGSYAFGDQEGSSYLSIPRASSDNNACRPRYTEHCLDFRPSQIMGNTNHFYLTERGFTSTGYVLGW